VFTRRKIFTYKAMSRRQSQTNKNQFSYRKEVHIEKKKKLAGSKVQLVHEEISHCFMLKTPDTLLGAHFL
jgi:hypothetical protein